MNVNYNQNTFIVQATGLTVTTCLPKFFIQKLIGNLQGWVLKRANISHIFLKETGKRKNIQFINTGKIPARASRIPHTFENLAS